ncbi:MAG TPA: aminotransferase class I/II-fold pyridoxal phosphate-dependent enzyme [Streptosporangiaceae bacterium]|nr:aminotransferase class I/II-fold pyridoxal phosphate-dependent enzyme [Streptosporangiaceae bacterium]
MDVRKAERLRQLPPFLFMETRRRIREARERGIDVISLGVGDPDGVTPPHVLAAFRAAAGDPAQRKYPAGESRGLPALRRTTAGWYGRRFGVRLDPGAEVCALIGSKEGNHHVALGLLDPGDVALVPDPAYPAYAAGAVLAGARVVSVPLRPERGYLLDPADISPADARAARLLWLNYPNNPTGAVATGEFFEEIVDFARRHDIVVINDNPYADLCFDGYRAPSILAAAGAMDVAVEFTSLSKTYSMAGWRIGMAAGNRDVIDAIVKVKENTDAGACTAVQVAAVAALDGPQDAVADSVAVYRRRRDRTVAALRDAGYAAAPPSATFYVWMAVPAGLTSTDFANRLLDAAGVVVIPGVGYGARGEGFVRLSLAVPDERLDEALARIVKAGDLSTKNDEGVRA